MTPPDHDQREDYDDRRGANPPPQSAPTRKSWYNRPVETGIVLGVALLGLLFAVNASNSRVRDAGARIRGTNNLKVIGIAFHDYADAHGEFPNNTYDLDGTPLLSWRVHLLPFVEEEGLYNLFKLDEPWDSPNNAQLIRHIPRVYRPPTGGTGGLTYYRGFSNAGAIFEPRMSSYRPRLQLFIDEPFDFTAIKDGLSNTILVVEAGDAVEWTKPDDLDASPGKPFPNLGGMRWRGGQFQLLMADGGVRMLRLDMDETKLRAMVSHSGGEAVTPD